METMWKKLERFCKTEMEREILDRAKSAKIWVRSLPDARRKDVIPDQDVTDFYLKYREEIDNIAKNCVSDGYKDDVDLAFAAVVFNFKQEIEKERKKRVSTQIV